MKKALLWFINTPRVCVCVCVLQRSQLLCFVEIGWRAAIRPADHPVANFDFDVVVGADGRRNTLEGEKIKNKSGSKYATPQGCSVHLTAAG